MPDSTLDPTLNLTELFDAPDMQEWRALTEKVLNGAPFDKKVKTPTPEGILLEPIYDRSAVEGQPLADTTPGEFPYLRGTRASGYRGKSWQICQALPYPTVEEFNQAAAQDTTRGQDAVLLQIDEGGHCGTLVQHEDDLLHALKGLDWDNLHLHIEAGMAAPAVAAALKRTGIQPLSGSVCMDPLTTLALHGEVPMTLTEARTLQAGHVTWLAENLPGFRGVGVDASWSVNAGGNAVTELALMLASAAETFRALTAEGLSVDAIAASCKVQVAVGADFFMETAKFRAARVLWAAFIKAAGGSGDSAKILLSAATSSWHQTKLDPWVNLLRGTSQAFSAVLGGVDILRVDPFDAPFGLPDTFSRRIARNTQLVLKHEAHLTEVVDPAGGSWTVETLTRELTARAWAQFQDMEKNGGLLAMLQDGSLRSLLEEQAADQRKRLGQRRLVKVGTNQFAFPEEKKLPLRQPDAAALAATREISLKTWLKKRRETDVSEKLHALSQHLSMDAVVEAVNAGATFAEALSACGEPLAARVNPIQLGRLSADYEALRENMEAYVAENGAPPKVLLAQMGPVKQHKLRSDFCQEFLKPSGFAIDASQRFDSAEEAAKAVIDSGAAVTVICSTDDTYPDLVPAFAKAVKAGAPETVVLLAGLLPDHLQAFKAAGLDDCIHMKANNIDLLKSLHEKTGVAS